MTSMLLRATASLALALVASCATQGIGAGAGSVVSGSSVGGDRFARLTETLEGYVENGQLPGGVVQINQNGRTIYAEAFGWRDVDGQVPMTEDTIFRIASQSKAIVSVAILMLQEEGRLTIQDPVSRYLPEWANVQVAVPREGGGYDLAPLRRPITLRDLLTHTSGIPYGSGFIGPIPGGDLWEEAGFVNWYFADKDQPIRELVRQMASLPMQAQPGERWIYGYNVDILGAIVEVASGEPLDQFLTTRIFEPLGMSDTYFYLPADKADRLVTVYSAGPNGLAEAPVEGRDVSQGAYVNGPRTAFSGGAGLVSTAHDYSRFLQMLLNEGELDSARILSRKTVELMTVNHLPANIGQQSPGTGMGLGVSVLEDVGQRGTLGSEGEFGWGGAYHSTYWVDPVEDLTVTYFTNVIPAPPTLDDFAKLRVMLYETIE